MGSKFSKSTKRSLTFFCINRTDFWWTLTTNPLHNKSNNLKPLTYINNHFKKKKYIYSQTTSYNKSSRFYCFCFLIFHFSIRSYYIYISLPAQCKLSINKHPRRLHIQKTIKSTSCITNKKKTNWANDSVCNVYK